MLRPLLAGLVNCLPEECWCRLPIACSERDALDVHRRATAGAAEGDTPEDAVGGAVLLQKDGVLPVRVEEADEALLEVTHLVRHLLRSIGQ